MTKVGRGVCRKDVKTKVREMCYTKMCSRHDLAMVPTNSP